MLWFCLVDVTTIYLIPFHGISNNISSAAAASNLTYDYDYDVTLRTVSGGWRIVFRWVDG